MSTRVRENECASVGANLCVAREGISFPSAMGRDVLRDMPAEEWSEVLKALARMAMCVCM